MTAIIRTCKKCGVTAFRTEGRTFKDGTEHIARICLNCNAHLDFAAQEMPPGMFVMPFGKHKGQPLQWIVDNDPDYAKWIQHEFDGKALGNRISILLG